MLNRLQLKDPRVVERRLMGRSQALDPLFQTFGMAPNSDYFPVVDQRASKTRFTQARVSELTDLQAAPVPMMEMLAGAPVPTMERLETIKITHVEQATARAWAVHDILLPASRQGPKLPLTDGREMAAQVARAWTTCQSGLSFDQVLPQLIAIAEATNSYLHPQVASRIWQDVAASACGRALSTENARWLKLFDAVARRDSDAILAIAPGLLQSVSGMKTSASEYLFFATGMAALCRGDYDGVEALLQRGDRNWMRPASRIPELRLMEAMMIAGRKGAAVPKSCGA
jgi:hypothetical protein